MLRMIITGALGALTCFMAAAERISLTGDDLSTWRADTGAWQIAGDAAQSPKDEKLLVAEPGKGIVLNGPTGKTVHLVSKAEFGDVRAHVEFMVSKDSNSGVYFEGRYELQILDSWGVEHPKYGDCGGIYERWDDKRNPPGYEGTAPCVNASLPPGSWQTYDVLFRAPRFDASGKKIANGKFEYVVHNGKIIHENVEVTGPTRASMFDDEKPTGPLMLQGDHGPVAYRNIWIEPLKGDQTVAMNQFFGMDTGTKDANHSTPKAQAEMLKELGYDGIGYTSFKGIPEMLGELKPRGLEMFTVYIGSTIKPDGFTYEPGLSDAALALRNHNAIIWVPIAAEGYAVSSEDGDAVAVKMLREMAGSTRQRIALYPHTGMWLEKVEDAVRVAKKVNLPNVGVTFNLCHWLNAGKGQNLKGLLELAAPYLFVVTINGADADGKDWGKLIQTLDHGTYDVANFLKTLKEVGYGGPIGLQGYGISGGVNDNLKRSMAAWIDLNKKL